MLEGKSLINSNSIPFLHMRVISFLELIKSHDHRFFKQLFLLICVNQMASALFRFIAALGRNIIVANTFGSFALLTVLVMGGFVLSRSK